MCAGRCVGCVCRCVARVCAVCAGVCVCWPCCADTHRYDATRHPAHPCRYKDLPSKIAAILALVTMRRDISPLCPTRAHLQRPTAACGVRCAACIAPRGTRALHGLSLAPPAPPYTCAHALTPARTRATCVTQVLPSAGLDAPAPTPAPAPATSNTNAFTEANEEASRMLPGCTRYGTRRLFLACCFAFPAAWIGLGISGWSTLVAACERVSRRTHTTKPIRRHHGALNYSSHSHSTPHHPTPHHPSLVLTPVPVPVSLC